MPKADLACSLLNGAGTSLVAVLVWKDSLGWMSAAPGREEERLIKGIKNIFLLISLDALRLSQTLPD